MTILECKALERIKRIAQAKPNSEEHAVLIGIAGAIAEIGEASIPIWLEGGQTTLNVWEKDLDAKTPQGEVGA